MNNIKVLRICQRKKNQSIVEPWLPIAPFLALFLTAEHNGRQQALVAGRQQFRDFFILK